MGDWERFRRALGAERLPAALVDLDALEANVDLLRGQLGDGPVTLRIATKSVRHVGLLKAIRDRGGPRFSGWMTFSAHETAFLATLGFDDFLLAYPISRIPEAEAIVDLVVRGKRVVTVVDDEQQVELLGRLAQNKGVVVPVALDVDVSWRTLGGRVHLGVRRSPIRSVDDARRVGRACLRKGVELVGIMAYEAQIAGLRDLSPGNPAMSQVVKWIKAKSRPLAVERRAAIVAALREDDHDVRLVNGGGTGSLSFTAQDPTVSEVTAGSGFLCPHLFDGYHGLPLRPAAFFALPVTRRPEAGWVTCQGGGYAASGGAGPDRLPVVHLPKGLKPLDLEGWGEVQTPFQVTGDVEPQLGDPVICRHGKGGELAERFPEFLMVRGDRVVDRQPSYRGQGMAFG